MALRCPPQGSSLTLLYIARTHHLYSYTGIYTSASDSSLTSTTAALIHINVAEREKQPPGNQTQL